MISDKIENLDSVKTVCKLVRQDEFLGHRRWVLDFKGHEAWVVEPMGEQTGKWVWQMKWPGDDAEKTGQVDALNCGYVYCYIDDGHWCNDEGLAILKHFYDFVVAELGLTAMPNLIGMSWGGFYLMRFAERYPECVAKIYLDSPMLSLQGYNGYWGMPGVRKCWPSLAILYCYRWLKNWNRDSRMPVNSFRNVAETKIPILLRYAADDRTLPPPNNSELFIPRFEAAGGVIEHVKRPGPHQPHGFNVPDEAGRIVDFFERGLAG